MTKESAALANAFGAKIGLSAPDLGLYLVMGRTAGAEALVRAAGAQVIMALPGSLNLLALMPVAVFLGLRGSPEIKHIGPVTIDSARFNQFLEALGLNHPSG